MGIDFSNNLMPSFGQMRQPLGRRLGANLGSDLPVVRTPEPAFSITAPNRRTPQRRTQPISSGRREDSARILAFDQMFKSDPSSYYYEAAPDFSMWDPNGLERAGSYKGFFNGLNAGETLMGRGEQMFRDALGAAGIDTGEFLYSFADQPWGSGFSGLLDQIYSGAQGSPNFNASTALANLGDTIAYMVGDYQSQSAAPAGQEALMEQLLALFSGGGTGDEAAPALTFPDLASILSSMYSGGGSIWG